MTSERHEVDPIHVGYRLDRPDGVLTVAIVISGNDGNTLTIEVDRDTAEFLEKGLHQLIEDFPAVERQLAATRWKSHLN